MNISVVLDRYVEQVSVEYCMQEWQLCSSIFSNYLPLSIFNSFPEHKSETVRNISMILGGFIGQINAE